MKINESHLDTFSALISWMRHTIIFFCVCVRVPRKAPSTEVTPNLTQFKTEAIWREYLFELLEMICAKSIITKKKHLQRQTGEDSEGDMCFMGCSYRISYVPSFNTSVGSWFPTCHLSTVDLQLRVIACRGGLLAPKRWLEIWNVVTLFMLEIPVNVQFSTGGGHLYQQQNASNFTKNVWSTFISPTRVWNWNLSESLCECVSLVGIVVNCFRSFWQTWTSTSGRSKKSTSTLTF